MRDKELVDSPSKFFQGSNGPQACFSVHQRQMKMPVPTRDYETVPQESVSLPKLHDVPRITFSLLRELFVYTSRTGPAYERRQHASPLPRIQICETSRLLGEDQLDLESPLSVDNTADAGAEVTTLQSAQGTRRRCLRLRTRRSRLKSSRTRGRSSI